jgi:hypothetical protein
MNYRMSFQKKIKEMLELMKIPNVAKYMLLSLEEAKENFRDEIESFQLECQITDNDYDTINNLNDTIFYDFDKIKGDSLPIWNYSQRSNTENYSEIFNSMECDPDLREHIFKEFFLKLKPLSST